MPAKAGEKVVERSDTQLLTRCKAAENGIDRRRSQRADSVIDAQPEPFYVYIIIVEMDFNISIILSIKIVMIKGR